MSIITLILLVLAFVCFALAAFRVASPRIELLAVGLAAWMLAQLLQVAAGAGGIT